MSSFFYFCVATGFEFLAGCGCWKLSHSDFKLAKKDPNSSPDVIRRAKIERFFAFFFFAASFVTAIGLYVYKGEQNTSDATFNSVTNGWAQATNQLGVLSNEYSGVTSKLAEVTSQLAHTQSQLANAKQLVPARTLKPEYKAKFIESARQYGGIDVSVQWLSTDPESEDFGKEISDVLTQSGWKVLNTGIMLSSTSIRGVEIQVHSWPYLPAAEIAKALIASGASVKIFTNSAEPFTITVGMRVNQ